MNLFWINVILMLLLSILLIGLVAISYILWKSDVKFSLRVRKLKRIERKKEIRCEDANSFLQNLIQASTEMMRTGRKDEFPSLLDYTIQGRYRKSKKYVDPVSRFRLQFSECGWIVLSLLEISALKESDKKAHVYPLDNEIFVFVKKYFDDKILNAGFETIDQSQCGMIALRLYEMTHDEKYRRYAQEMYNWILTFDTTYGVLYRKGHDRIVVDSIGMAIPFLIKYAEICNQPHARQVAIKTIEQYAIYGCDINTGIPAYAYEMMEPHLKLGRANWGRGISWFVIGLCYANKEDLCPEAQKIIDRFNNTMKEIWLRDKNFGQFIGQSKQHDLSAELPILYYMKRKEIISPTEDELLDYSLMMHDGVMYNSSSSYTGIIQYGVPTGPNMLSQAFMIRLLSL